MSERREPTRAQRLVTVVILVVVAGACAPSRAPGFASNGERIYRTGTSDSGERIAPTGVRTGMHRLTCATCHGDDGTGGRAHVMMRQIDAPDITWRSLTEVHGNGHADHPPYADATLERAIRSGVDPSGRPLDSDMPRFRISDAHLEDLINFLRTLGGGPEENGG